MYHHHQTRIFVQQQNDFPRAENRAMIQTLTSPSNCITCSEPIVSAEESELRLENALLRSEIDTLTCFIERLNSFRSLYPESAASISNWHFTVGVMTSFSVKEVASLARQGTQMWTGNEILNLNEYYYRYFPWYARNAPGFVHEASRASALVPVDASSLVANLMNHVTWQQIFPSIIGDVTMMESRHRGFQMINVDFMPRISPLSQTRNVKLLRRSSHIENDAWVIADISEYFTSYERHSRPKFMRFPSGCLVQHIANGISKVTILDHWVYKEDEVINIFNPNSEFGAQRWLTALQRHCYNTWSISLPPVVQHIQMLNPSCHTNLLNLSTHMVYVFCTGVCGITGQNWNRIGTVGVPMMNNFRMFARESRDMRGIPYFLVSAAGLARMQARPESMFGLLNRTRKQDIWNYLDWVRDMKELIRIQRCPNPGNEVSVFSIQCTGSQEWYLIQETYLEASGAMIIHACIEASYFAAVINGGDLSGFKLLPCGLTIVPHGLQECFVSAGSQVMVDQAIVTSSNELVSYMENMVTGTLGNVQNARR